MFYFSALILVYIIQVLKYYKYLINVYVFQIIVVFLHQKSIKQLRSGGNSNSAIEIMTKIINNYSYTNAAGMVISIRTEKYGIAGFDVFVTVNKLGVKDKKSYLFKNLKGEWLIDTDTNINGRPLMVKPADDVLKAILADKAQPTEERKQYDAAERERKQKEREWDNLYNEGAEGYNPYRRGTQGIKDNTPYYKGDNDPE